MSVLAVVATIRPGRAMTYTFTNFDVPGAAATLAVGISNAGSVTGVEQVSSDLPATGFIRAADGSFTLFNVPDASVTEPLGINSAGQVVGVYTIGSQSTVHAFLRGADGTFTSLDVPSATGTYAAGINDLGQVVITTVDASGNQSYFVRNADGSLQPLSVPGIPFAINDAGIVAGSFFKSSFLSGYVTSPDGSVTSIDDPAADGSETQALGVNDLGLVSGSYVDPTQNRHFGFVRGLDGGFTNFADPDATKDTFAYGINDAGVIAGNYVSATGYHSFIATPTTDVPEPAASAVLASSVALWGSLRLRRRRRG